jgi:hypothetical protein
MAIIGICIAMPACEKGNAQSIGYSLEFLNHGKDPIGVARFDPDGQRGPVPGGLGPSLTEGKYMAFMPGDNQQPIPQFVVVEWTIEPRSQESADLYGRPDKYTPKWMADHAQFIARLQRFNRNIDLQPILLPELIEQVRANRQNTQLLLKIVFKDGDVSITASAKKWR